MDQLESQESDPLLAPYRHDPQERPIERSSDSGRRISSLFGHPSNHVLIIVAARTVGQAGILTNIFQFLYFHRALDWSAIAVSITTLMASNLPDVLAAVTGAMTDTLLSCFSMLYVGLVLEFLGSSLLLLAAILEYNFYHNTITHHAVEDETAKLIILISLSLYILGVAASKGSQIPLGMEAYWRRGQTGEEAKKFFPRFYWVMNAAALVSISVLSLVELNYGFHIGFIPACLSYLFSIVVLLAGRKSLYFSTYMSESTNLRKIILTLREATRVYKARRRARVEQGIRSPAPESFISYADESDNPNISDDDVVNVRNFCSMVLVLLSTLFFGVLMAQTLTVFTLQGNHMALPIDQNWTYHPDMLHIPSALVSNVSILSILVAIPLLYGCIYPWMGDASRRWRLTLFRRMGVGMFIAVLSTASATVVEVERRHADRWNQTVRFDSGLDLTTTASSVSVFWQIPQYALSGFAETLVFLSAFEFAYSRSPLSLKGLSVGLVYCMQGLAGLLSALLIFVMNAIRGNILYSNDAPGHMHWYFLSLSGIILVGVGFFSVATLRYVFISRRGRVM